MRTFLSSNVVRMVGIVLLALALVPRAALSWDCEEFAGCTLCEDVPVRGSDVTCDLAICDDHVHSECS